MAYKYIISDKGKTDYITIIEYLTQNTSRTYAVKIGRAIIDKIRKTCKNPKLYQICPAPRLQKKSIRAIPVMNYSIYYAIDDTMQLLHIYRIRSNKQNNRKLKMD